MNKILAKNKDGISIAAIDFFSFGHLLGGYIEFIIVDALYIVIFGVIVIEISIFTVFLCGVLWEIIENTYLFKRNIKFGYRRDSFLNSSIDVVMLTIGGLFASFCLELNLETFLITSSVFIIGIILLMSIYANKIIDLFRGLSK
ncbi:MAG: DUF2585 family protein [Candidatus Lokiarchaeota archaeon]|nr:DUF2585 family protein [Candidatus Lokiarchaeota archaeon]